eukprot:CAMPEP_0178505802 /NCGR_PEP_ID=MMETSP0696-20121128/19323_1 /TAXON_ID=265572 /ORGANISM="Extubocellulus spinifer, Strain CCMP396" /LENGTH=292 /DNA_ID=CAMNT_0020135133 /DNA_START=147 /DNA_END=1025 /DNA_ORIENTATION=+
MKLGAFGFILGYSSLLTDAAPTASEQEKDSAGATPVADQTLRGGASAQRELWMPRPEPCPDGDGYYCGNNPSLLSISRADLYDGVLYYCKDGHYSKKRDCAEKYGGFCKVGPPTQPDYCEIGPQPDHPNPGHPSKGCPYNREGTYCGSNEYWPDDVQSKLDPGTLYYCSNGHYYFKYDCNYNGKVCDVLGYPYDDKCKKTEAPSASPSESPYPTETYSEYPSASPSESMVPTVTPCHPGKYYCGDKDLHQDPDMIYKCDQYGNYRFFKQCKEPCTNVYDSDYVQCPEDHHPY